MHGNRAVFVAQNGINLLRVLAGNQAQRVVVIAADAVGNIATFAIADADNFTAGKVTRDGFDAFGSRELPRSRIARVAPASTLISPAGGAPKIQRLRFSSGDSCAWKRVPTDTLSITSAITRDGCRRQ